MTFHSATGTRDLTDNASNEYLEETNGRPNTQISEVDFLSASWIVLVATLKDSNQEALQNIIDSAIDNTDDISNLTLVQTTKLLLESLDEEQYAVGNIDNIVSQVDLAESFPQSKQEYSNAVSALTMAQSGLRSGCPSCDDFLAGNLSDMSDAEVLACMGQCMGYDPNAGYCQDPDADNYMAAADCEYNGGGGGFGDTFVGGLFNDLWDATTDNLGLILGGIFSSGGSNNNNNNNNNNGGGGDNGDDNEEKEIDWGKIAIWGGVVIAIGLGAYFIFRKK
jgi:hypothetical protein